MVKIVNYQKKQTESGNEFFVLELQGGIEMVRSHKTGLYYATIKKTSITSTFDEETCKALIGTELEGNITKVMTEPYEYTIKQTGEVTILNYKFVYMPDSHERLNEEKEIQKLLADESNFSKNGKHEGEPVL